MSDAYEDKHMSEDGMIYRDKFVAGWPFHAIMGLGLLACLLPMFALPVFTLVTVLSLVLPAALLVVLWLMFSVLRVSVSTTHVYIQLGLFGPRIEVADLESAEVIDYDWKKYGGWGIRVARDGSIAYNFMSDAGQAVEIKYRSTGGKVKTVVVSSKEPGALVRAIEQAREASGVVLDLEEGEVLFEQEQATHHATSETH